MTALANVAFYDDLATVVAQLLTEFGAPAVLRRSKQNNYDPTTGQPFEPAVVDEPIIAAVFDIGYDKPIPNTLVQVGDLTVYVSAIGLPEAKVTDQLVWQGVVYKIVGVISTAPAGEPIIYQWLARK